jgi:hypothetical protein
VRGFARLEGSRFNACPIDHAIFALLTCFAETGAKQAAPGNDPALGCSVGLSDGDAGSKHRAG